MSGFTESIPFANVSLEGFPLRYWFFVVLTLLLTGAMGFGTFTTARLLRMWKPDRNLLLLPAENALRIVLIVGCVLLGWLSGLSPAQLGWSDGGQSWARLAWIGVAWGVGVAGFFFLATRWLVAGTGGRFYSTTLIDAILPRTGRDAVWVAVVMIFVVLLEELLFRSLLLGGLQLIAPTWTLLLLWGVLFGAMHSPQGLWGMAGAGLAGVLFGILFLIYGSLITPVVAHYVANVLQIGLAMRLQNRAALPSIAPAAWRPASLWRGGCTRP